MPVHYEHVYSHLLPKSGVLFESQLQHGILDPGSLNHSVVVDEVALIELDLFFQMSGYSSVLCEPKF